MKRSAFTLIELLVVIVIIAMLAAMLVPAVNRARETARRAQCVSRQRDIAFAMITYSGANNGLPGYLNELGKTPIHSWAIAVFPNIGEDKRYGALMKSAPSATETAQAIAPVPALLCPSGDSRQGNTPLDYVVNCGPVTENDNDKVIPAFSLFKDRRSLLNQTNKKVKIEEIPDGASHTILLSENVNAGTWWSGNGDPTPGSGKDWHNWPPMDESATFFRNVDDVKFLGFMWSRSQEYIPNSPAQVPRPRPSSKHPGTVVAAYADGTVKPINDDVSITEWFKAVCPDDENWDAQP
jgi:prepilin-type N-terminal cleavage/methylation domain-containing protein